MRRQLPEGPEVRTIADQLAASLRGATLEGVEVLGGRYERHGPPPGLASVVFPARVASVGCKGKLIWFEMHDGQGEPRFIWNTLGMTGRWSRKREEHARVLFRTSVGDIYFCDVRNFGTLHFNRSPAEHGKKVKSLGLDLLVEDVSLFSFKQRLMRRAKKTIAETLMDQSITAGCGNYLKCEGLYHSEISPHRQTQSLTDDELERLLASLTDTMRASYRAKGHTMSDYRDLTGEKGTYAFSLAVYNRARDPMGNTVVREKTRDGRTTHWVPDRQR